MKFLLLVSMIVASSFASANDDGWSIKCFEKGNHGPDLAYIINVDGQGHPTADRSIQLEDCTRGRDSEDFDCRKRGELKKRERQNESCLVLDEHHDGVNNGSWSLCYQQQDTVTSPRLVPVTVTDDRQGSTVYCERELLRIL